MRIERTKDTRSELDGLLLVCCFYLSICLLTSIDHHQGEGQINETVPKNRISYFFYLARYRRKLRSKLDTVKKQFSDQNTSSSFRLHHQHSHGSTFDDMGSNIKNRFISIVIRFDFTFP